MINLLYIFLGIILLKFLFNLSKFVQCKRYLNKYDYWKENPTLELALELEELQPQVIKLFKSADIQDSQRPHIEPVGYGKGLETMVSVFGNFTSPREDIVVTVLRMFHQAIGTYRSRMLEGFNPLYWVEFIVNLPKQVLTYLGVSSESVVIKISQVIYGVFVVFVAVSSFLFALYKPEIETLVRGWFSGLIP